MSRTDKDTKSVRGPRSKKKNERSRKDPHRPRTLKEHELEPILARLGEHVLEWSPAQQQAAAGVLVAELGRDLNGDWEYADNFRAARENNALETSAYWDAARKGCCGVIDERIDTREGAILIGCNFGH